MTQEDKQLLLVDLCARLPYGVIVQVNDGLKGAYDSQLVQVFCDRVSCSVNVRNPKECICIDSVKPYLRPLSSMTEEEKVEYTSYCFEQPFLQKDKTPNLGSVPMCIDWLNAHHFDYRGLIQKGLAISTEEFNPYKN